MLEEYVLVMVINLYYGYSKAYWSIRLQYTACSTVYWPISVNINQTRDKGSSSNTNIPQSSNFSLSEHSLYRNLVFEPVQLGQMACTNVMSDATLSDWGSPIQNKVVFVHSEEPEKYTPLRFKISVKMNINFEKYVLHETASNSCSFNEKQIYLKISLHSEGKSNEIKIYRNEEIQ